MNAPVKPSKATAEHIARIRSLRAEGLPANAIAREMGCLEKTIEVICRRHQIPSAYRKVSPCGMTSDEHNPRDVRKATIKHLQDIHREHGFNKTWANYDIPPEHFQPMALPSGCQISSTGLGGLAGISR